MNNVSDTFLVQFRSLETSSRLFYNIQKMLLHEISSFLVLDGYQF